MGLFDFIANAQKKMVEFQNKTQDNFAELQKRINANPVDADLMQLKSKIKADKPRRSRVANQIINRFYADYPEIPFISDDRPADWIERAELLPKQSIISKETMTRFSDGLLPGHVYMLYWLKRYTNKKVPVYFEYKYGIDFEKEKAFLFERGYLDDINKPTDKGEEAINRHIAVIESHTPPKPDSAAQILAQRDSLIRNGFAEYEFVVNRDCCSLCGELAGKHFPVRSLKIGVNAPPMHEGCRCCIAPYSDDAEYEEWLNSL